MGATKSCCCCEAVMPDCAVETMDGNELRELTDSKEKKKMD